MARHALIATRVSAQTKARFASHARRNELSESALLHRLIDMALLSAIDSPESQVADPAAVLPGTRVYVRLRTEDYALLRERAERRQMATATYASILLRAHLRRLKPLPDRELAELKRAVSALSMIGRNLNQIARVANQTGKTEGPSASDLRALLRALEGLRDHVKELIRVNAESWETGNAETQNR